MRLFVFSANKSEHTFGEGRLVVIDFEDRPLFDDGPDAIDVHKWSPSVESGHKKSRSRD
jgi:hypothetical protein